MATFCSDCGQELPRDDARFCNNCGAVRHSQVANPRSFAGTDNRPLSVAMQAGDAQGALHGQSGQMTQTASSVPPLTPPPVQQRPGGVKANPGNAEQLDFPALPSTPLSFSSVAPQSFLPSRELHVKVWRGTNSSPGEPAEVEAAQQRGVSSPPPENRSFTGITPADPLMADLPTMPVESIAPLRPPQIFAENIATTPHLTSSIEQAQPAREQLWHTQQTPPQQTDGNPADNIDIAHLSTMHLQAQGQTQARPAPAALPQIGYATAHAAQRGISTPTTPVPRARKRQSLIIGGIAVALLLLLALGSWIVIAQPFRVPPVTDVQQSFTDSRLRISLRYPNGWKQPQVDYNKKSITLQDASDTAQMNIRIADPGAETPESYLQKQAAQIGISNPRPVTTVSFGGASWQELQGDTQVKGAEYTCAVFTATYKNHLYTITQLAPRSVYADEEKLVFSPTLQSLGFI